MDAEDSLRHARAVSAEGSILGAVLLSSLTLACSSHPLPFSPAGPNAAPDPSALGPYAVGVRTLTLPDPRRTTTSTATGERTARTVVTEIWYPAADEARGKPGRVYHVDDLLPPDLRSMFDGAPKIELMTNAVLDAPPRREGETFPLVLFSHGNGGVRMQSTFFTTFLASHGYVVVAPDHEGDTLADFLRRGGLHASDVIGVYDDRTDDLRFLIDRFTNLPKDDPLIGLVDASQIGTSGHSFGALTAVRTSGIDARVKACVAQAPPGYTLAWIGVDRMLDALGIPILLQSGGLDRTLPPDEHAATLWKEMGAPSWWLTLKTAGHFTFSDLCTLDLGAIQRASDIGIGEVLEDGCGPMNLAPPVAFPLIRNFAVAMFNASLRGSKASERFLDPAHAPSAGQSDGEISIQTKP
jgi:predicted dienelactone hydrolase